MNYEEAIACFEKALKIDPMCAEAYEGEFDAYMAMGDFQKAMKVAEKGVKKLTSGGADANEQCYQAADDAMKGSTPVGNCLYFRTVIPEINGQIIGGHVFY